jgi:hypothetical protein
LFLCLITEAQSHEYIWGSGGIAPPFLASALDGDECSASLPAALLPRKLPRYALDRRLDGPQSRSGRCEEKIILALAGNRTLTIQPVAEPTELSRIPTKMYPQSRSGRGFMLRSKQEAGIS